MDLTRIYHDSHGCQADILQMLFREPEWAANRIQEGDNAIAEFNEMKMQIFLLSKLLNDLVIRYKKEYR